MSEGFGLKEKVEQLEKELAVQTIANQHAFGALIKAVNELYPNKDLYDGLTKFVRKNLILNVLKTSLIFTRPF